MDTAQAGQDIAHSESVVVGKRHSLPSIQVRTKLPINLVEMLYKSLV